MDKSLTATALPDAAADAASVAARSAADAEANRKLAPEVVRAVRDAGFARHFVPLGHGGRQGTFRELTTAVAVLGEACAATAWCASLSAHMSRMAAHLPAAGLDELWADGPDPLLVGSLTPLGSAEPVDGGYRLSGRWPFISAVDHSDWALLAAVTRTDEGPQPRVFAVPRAQYRTMDTWFNVGMAGTGSNTLIVDGVVVPEARSMSREDLFTGRPAAVDAPCYAVPMQATTTMFAAPALGAARGALKAWLGHVTPKIAAAARNPVQALPGMPTFNRAAHDVVLARSAAEIDAAQMLLDRASATADLGPAITRLDTMRAWRDCAVATDALVTVVNRLFRGVGTTGQARGNAVQRFWRDVNSLAGHQGLQVESAAVAYSHEVIEV
ncbi:acyl-CoA dehydrogenase family protein [Saccharothrix syringae]|uniref:Hydrolase n=1 Tax=Saccharothrix syringae TaxID=103733 RepID=A0A5Q0GXL1_SACSY|nr:hydrolase [Saccharothrix syringae]QFZ18807.1 hydrolase [Saccharothrix syringae]